jgi:tetratricopeptide (TPR) repeat protein
MNSLFHTLKQASLLISLLLLFSCAGDRVKPADDHKLEVQAIKVTEHIDVDSDVESDFEEAVALMQAKKYQQAVEVLSSVIAREKRLPAPYVNIAMAYIQLDDNAAAEKNLISALKLDIGHPVANNELGLLYRKQGKFKGARTAYENAIRDNSQYLPAIRNLGVLCDLYMHDYDCALQQYEDYLELRPDDKTMAIWVFDVKQRLGK